MTHQFALATTALVAALSVPTDSYSQTFGEARLFDLSVDLFPLIPGAATPPSITFFNISRQTSARIVLYDEGDNVSSAQNVTRSLAEGIVAQTFLPPGVESGVVAMAEDGIFGEVSVGARASEIGDYAGGVTFSFSYSLSPNTRAVFHLKSETTSFVSGALAGVSPLSAHYAQSSANVCYVGTHDATGKCFPVSSTNGIRQEGEIPGIGTYIDANVSSQLKTGYVSGTISVVGANALVSPVPEPRIYLLLSVGLAFIAVAARRARR